ncbi:peroxidase superfamily protein [Artemisia annua]|uniref:peroxidase n=1 Tax=Artemisia annua TaxID=35608 RepID=A0A2U1KLC8_ARTAN|nr:peroxidase superfamily protein [Artemisia annua]
MTCEGMYVILQGFTTESVPFQGEKNSSTSLDAPKGLDIIYTIENKLASDCPGTVLCADALTTVAIDAAFLAGEPYWHVAVGRNDSKNK